MLSFKINSIESNYSNRGQKAEQIFRYAMTGKMMRADNRKGADLGDIQIKSARATICPGEDIETYVLEDVASRYAYITKDYVVYMMDKAEYIEFCQMFATKTVDSQRNGGKTKMRLGHETKRLISYLEMVVETQGF